MAGRFPHATIAMVYDLDGTLAPQPMQEYTILPKLGIQPRKSWADVKLEVNCTTRAT